MTQVPAIQFQLMSTDEVIQELVDDVGDTDAIEVVSRGVEKDTAALEFGLGEIATVIAIVKDLGGLAKKIHDRLKKNDDRKIIVQTPLGRTEFVSSKTLSEEEVRRILTQLAGI